MDSRFIHSNMRTFLGNHFKAETFQCLYSLRAGDIARKLHAAAKAGSVKK